jgi:hypothetical protein
MTQAIPSGITDQYVYFEAPPGLSTWTVYGARNGAAAAAFTTPTVAEVDSTNMPGLYSLLLDEQTTITAANTSEVLALHISASGWGGTVMYVNLIGDMDVNVASMNGTTVIGAGISGDLWRG